MKKGIIKYIFMYDWVSGCNVPQMNWAQTANHGVVPLASSRTYGLIEKCNKRPYTTPPNACATRDRASC